MRIRPESGLRNPEQDASPGRRAGQRLAGRALLFAPGIEPFAVEHAARTILFAELYVRLCPYAVKHSDHSSPNRAVERPASLPQLGELGS